MSWRHRRGCGPGHRRKRGHLFPSTVNPTREDVQQVRSIILLAKTLRVSLAREEPPSLPEQKGMPIKEGQKLKLLGLLQQSFKAPG